MGLSGVDMVRECVVGGGSLRLEGRFCVGGRVTHAISNFWVELWFGKSFQ